MTTTNRTPAPTAATTGDRFLRLVLRLDALASGAIGAGFLALNAVLDDWLGTPAALTVGTGLFLLAYAGFVWFVASRRPLRRAGVLAVIALNLFWVAGSVLYAAYGDDLTALGVAFTLVQAAAVLGFAVLEAVGLRSLRLGR
jgi:hypothetical protein